MDTQPIINLFNQLLTVGAAVAAVICAFFIMLAGYQYMTAGGSSHAVDSAKGSLYHALISFAIVILRKVVASLVGSALSLRFNHDRLPSRGYGGRFCDSMGLMTSQAAFLKAGKRGARPERAPLGRPGERPQGFGAFAGVSSVSKSCGNAWRTRPAVSTRRSGR